MTQQVYNVQNLHIPKKSLALPGSQEALGILDEYSNTLDECSCLVEANNLQGLGPWTMG